MTTDPWEMLNIQDAEIDKLRAEVEALREALEKIVALGGAMPDDAEEVQIAKSALAAAGRE
jgi:hypothetical protein